MPGRDSRRENVHGAFPVCRRQLAWLHVHYRGPYVLIRKSINRAWQLSSAIRWGFFDLPPEPSAEILRDLGARFVGRKPPLRFAAETGREILALGPAHRGLALWLADALLARALGWDRPVPLLASHLTRTAFRLEGEAWLAACASAWGRGAVAAFDLHLDLTRHADALRAAHLRRPGKDTAAIITALLTEDAIPAQAGVEASDRAARRLFGRLTSLGLVRELTGRPTFRLYGL